MPEMGRCRFYRRLRTDEAVRGQSDSRRHSQACLQNTPDEARNIRAIHIRSGAFRFSLVAGAETGLVPVRSSLGERRSAHVEAAVYV